MLVLFGGPAGAGKSTLARAWCAARQRAVHIELDEVRHRIVGGRVDSQEGGPEQAAQYGASVRATVALARSFAADGYDVAVDDVFEPAAVERYWQPALDGLDHRLVVVLPSLDTVLGRSRGRAKRVREEHSRAQHAACSAWPASDRIDTTSLSIDESLALVYARLGSSGVANLDQRMGKTVRLATADDLPAVLALSQAWEAEGITIGYLADTLEHLPPRLGALFFVAELAGEVVGYAIGAIRTSEGLAVIPEGVRYLEVEDLYVRADHRSRGCGSALLRHLGEAARAADVERALVYSSNRAWERTARFYGSHGFGMWFIRMVR